MKVSSIDQHNNLRDSISFQIAIWISKYLFELQFKVRILVVIKQKKNWKKKKKKKLKNNKTIIMIRRK